MRTSQNPIKQMLHRACRLRADRAGNALLEFAIIAPVLVMFSVGTFAVGFHLDRYLQMDHVVRAAANMYSRGIDFTLPGTRQLLLESTRGIPISDASGSGIIYLSEITVAEAGINSGLPVIVHRIGIGNQGLGTSRVGTPPVGAHGGVIDYENSSLALAVLPAGVTIVMGQTLYVAEFIQQPNDISMPGFMSLDRLYRAAYF